MPQLRTNRFMNACRHPYTEWQSTKAKRKHRKAHPDCACCGAKPTFFGKNSDVHHDIPVHVFPERACDPTNLTTLCRHCHFEIGHLENWKDWNIALNQTIKAMRIAIEDTAISGKDSIPRPTITMKTG